MVLIGTMKRYCPSRLPLPFIARSAATLVDSMRHGKVSQDCHDLNSKSSNASFIEDHLSAVAQMEEMEAI
ncbi:unnamed protein product [Penicillium camemberti]|uniref:Str. FM013 n=1 Tax=Penicillium camemberti (strain FM 013) TaxID=1429867 RepID=A0A0G4NXZ9_PENC3|nr:unnamed protein product [Penicillium camemberti]